MGELHWCWYRLGTYRAYWIDRTYFRLREWASPLVAIINLVGLLLATRTNLYHMIRANVTQWMLTFVGLIAMLSIISWLKSQEMVSDSLFVLALWKPNTAVIGGGVTQRFTCLCKAIKSELADKVGVKNSLWPTVRYSDQWALIKLLNKDAE